MRPNRAWLGALAAMSLAGGLAGPAQAIIISNNIAGTSSQADYGCLGFLVTLLGSNCTWDNGVITTFSFVPPASSGPIQVSGYYAAGDSPWDRNGAPDDIGGTPGDGKLALPLSGQVTIDDKGTPCDADDTLTATVSYGAAKRNFPGGPGTQGEEGWGDGDLSFDLAETVVDSAAPNTSGGCDYVIGDAGFPPMIPTANGGANQYGDDLDIGTNSGQVVWEPNDGTDYTGIIPSISSLEENPNSGAPLTVTNGPSYVCEFFNGAVGPCEADGSHHDTVSGGTRATIENSIWKVSTDAGGNIVAATAFPLNEQAVGTGGQPSWDAPMWQFTGTCINCGANAADDSAATIVDTAVTIDILANDTGFTDPVTVTLPGGGTTAQGGTVVINGTNPGAQNQIDVTYTPPGGFVGSDTFDYDITGLIATVTVDVQADLMPTANALTGPAIDTQGVSPDTVSQSVNAFTSGGNSPGNTPATVAASLGAGSAAGSCSVDANVGTVTFTPAAASFTGNGICDYTITDANGDMASNTATFAIPDVQPTVGSPGGSGTTGSTVAINVSITLGNGSLAQHTLTAAGGANGGTTANGGTVTVTGSTASSVQLSYVSAAGFTGTDSFDVTLTDGDGDQATGTVTINVSEDTSGDIALELPGGSSAIGPLGLLWLAGLPLLRRRRRH